MVVLFLRIVRRTATATRWLNFKINVVEKLIYDKQFNPADKEIEDAVDVVLANDVEAKATIEMLRKFLLSTKKKSPGSKGIRHVIEHRLERPKTDNMMLAWGWLKPSDIFHTSDIFKNIDLEAAIKRFEQKFKDTVKK